MKENETKEEIKNSELKETKKINTISLFVLIVGIIFMLVGCVLTITSIDKDNNDNESSNNNENTNNSEENSDEEVIIKEIEITDKELKALDNLPVISINNNSIPLYNVFQSKKVTVENVDISIIVANAINKIEHENNCVLDDIKANNLCDFTVKLENLKAKIKELYGDFKYELPTKVQGSGLLSCTITGNHYACSNSGGGFYAGPLEKYFGVEFRTEQGLMLKENIKAETDDEYVYIYQNFARIKLTMKNNNPEDVNNFEFRAYRYLDTDELLSDKVFLGKDYYEEVPTTPFLTKISKELEGNLTIFKHTFKIAEDGSYVWVSTEEVK